MSYWKDKEAELEKDVKSNEFVNKVTFREIYEEDPDLLYTAFQLQKADAKLEQLKECLAQRDKELDEIKKILKQYDYLGIVPPINRMSNTELNNEIFKDLLVEIREVESK